MRTGVELRGAIEPEKDRDTKAPSTCSNLIKELQKEKKQGCLDNYNKRITKTNFNTFYDPR